MAYIQAGSPGYSVVLYKATSGGLVHGADLPANQTFSVGCAVQTPNGLMHPVLWQSQRYFVYPYNLTPRTLYALQKKCPGSALAGATDAPASTGWHLPAAVAAGLAAGFWLGKKAKRSR